jgi:putative membrane protein
MNRTCLLFLALTMAMAACRSSSDRDDDRWPAGQTPTGSSTVDGTRKTAPAADPSARGSTTTAAMNDGTRDGSKSGDGMKALSAEDRKFVEKANQGGIFEVKTSRLALEKSVSGPTREFAQMMIDDHGKANRDLEAIVKKKGGRVTDVLDAEHQEKLDQLRTKDGRDFEAAYRDAQTKSHDEAIRLFERASKEADDADIRYFANRLLPTLREHRKHLDEQPMK